MSPRGGEICQLVAVAVEALTFRHIVDPILADDRLTSAQCQRLSSLLEIQARERIDQFLEGCRSEYIMKRVALYDLEHRTGLFPPGISPGKVFNEFMLIDYDPAKFDIALSRLPASHFAREVAFLQETQRLIEQSKDQNYAQRKSLWKPIDQQMKDANLILGVILSSPIGPIDEAATRGNTRLNGYRCLIAVKLSQLENRRYPEDLESAVKAAGLEEVPDDPYLAGGKIRLAIINSRPVVYSVASDFKDDGGRRDWKFSNQPGDFLFPMPGT
jgi:hypothetical protein